MNTPPRTSSPRDLYQEVTDRIIAALDAGVAPWVPPYAARAGLPRNGLTGRPYAGINVLLLWMTAQARGYRSPAWYTFHQARLLGGGVRKGERATLVTFWRTRTITDAATGEEKHVPLLRHFYVFNRAQVDGLPDEMAEPERPQWERLAAAERLIQDSGAQIAEGGPPPCYRPSTDDIHMPALTIYATREGYYVDLLHELTHWTGHPRRLARPMTGGFGSPEYAREELVAEMGSAFLCASFGIAGRLQHPEYLGGWLARLREDTHAIFHAASEARQAVEYLTALRGRTASERADGEADGGHLVASGEAAAWAPFAIPVLHSSATGCTEGGHGGVHGVEWLTHTRIVHLEGDSHMSTLTIDTAFDYLGLRDRPARCHLRAFEQGTGDVVLLVTDLGDANPGASVTNTIEMIVTQAVQCYGLDAERVMVIEHHDTRRVPGAPARRDDGEDFDLVTFERAGAVFRAPSWRPIRKYQAEAIVGRPLP